MKQIGWYSVVYKTFHHDCHGENDIPIYIDEVLEKERYNEYLTRRDDRTGT